VIPRQVSSYRFPSFIIDEFAFQADLYYNKLLKINKFDR